MNQKSSSKIYNLYFFGVIGQAVHQAVLKKATQIPKAGHPILRILEKIYDILWGGGGVVNLCGLCMCEA
jgi:hypothetical protein